MGLTFFLHFSSCGGVQASWESGGRFRAVLPNMHLLCILFSYKATKLIWHRDSYLTHQLLKFDCTAVPALSSCLLANAAKVMLLCLICVYPVIIHTKSAAMNVLSLIVPVWNGACLCD